jgi:hypothetical protein
MTIRLSMFGAAIAMAMLAGAAQAQSRPQGFPEGSFQVAQGSTCQSFQDMCAARCKTRAPTDANCVSDHCTPKLGQCRQTGCWQEGARYGGGKTCGLAK